MKIALVNLASFGDCINSTLMVGPIKAAFPDSILTVHVASKYSDAYWYCPGVDQIIEHHAATKDQAFNLYNSVPDKIRTMGYDKILIPAPILHPGEWESLKHPELGKNLIYSFVRELERHDIPYGLPLVTRLQLTPDEIVTARKFLAGVPTGRRNVLMEVHGESGQTHWTPAWTKTVGKHLSQRPTNLFISRANFSGDLLELTNGLNLQHFNAYWVGNLSLRCCAELFNHCQIFFSVSSGLANVCNTDHCKTDIKWFEVINSPVNATAPIRSAGRTYWYQNDIQKYIGLLRLHDV